MEKSLKGQVTIVTGVSRSQGIGASISRKIAPLGSHLFLTGWPEYDQNEHSDSELKRLLRELRMAGSEVEWMPLDLTLPDSAVTLLEAVSRRFGKAHVLINNACFWLGDSIDTLDAGSLDRHYAVNYHHPGGRGREIRNHRECGGSWANRHRLHDSRDAAGVASAILAWAVG